MKTKFIINTAMGNYTRHVSKRLDLVGEFLSGIARLNVPVRTGFLKGSMFSKMSEPLTVKVGNMAFYAIYIEFGTGEFAENGKGRKGGWFFVDERGKGYFTKGNKPQPFLRPLLIDYEDEIMRILTS